MEHANEECAQHHQMQQVILTCIWNYAVYYVCQHICLKKELTVRFGFMCPDLMGFVNNIHLYSLFTFILQCI